MSALILWNLLNELGKILSLFSNECNKFDNKRARNLEYIYHVTLIKYIIMEYSYVYIHT